MRSFFPAANLDRRQIPRRTVGAVLIAVAVVAGFAALRASRGAAVGHGIVFQAKVGGFYQLFTINPDGSGLRQITQLAFRKSSIPGAEQPAWSPDGKRIVFDSDYRPTKRQVINLFTIRPDGSGLARVPLYTGQFNGSPAYSPDGKSITFTWDLDATPGHQQGIDIANADGSEARRVTAVQRPNVLNERSSWSPDGSWLAYVEMRGPDESAIVKIRPDGTGAAELTPWELSANNPKWSPDGSKILFNSYNGSHPGESANLYTVKSNGGGLVQLTRFKGGRLNAYAGGWSPDGKRIVFHLRASSPDGVNQLFVMDADGHSMRQLTHLPRGSNLGYASWSPAG